MTIREAAQRLGKSESALRRAIKAKRLYAKMVKDKYDITEEALDAYAPNWREVGAPMLDIEGIERLRVESETLRREAQETRRRLEAFDSQIEELQKANRSLREQLHDAEKRAVLADELAADKEQLHRQLDTKDEQIKEAQKALDHNQQLLAYAQLPWWRKLGRKALPAAPVDMESEDKG